MKIEQIRARMAEIEAELRAINETVGDSALPVDQQTRWDELETEHRSLGEQRGAWERRQAFLKAAASQSDNHVAGDHRDAPNVVRDKKVYETGTDVRTLSVRDAQEMALRAMESADYNVGLSAEQQRDLERKVRSARDGGDIARRLLVTENDDYRAAWQQLVTESTVVLTPEQGRALQAFKEYRAMSEGTTTAGGFGIPVLIDPSIILTTQGAMNPFLQICRQENITTNAWKGVSSAGVSWGFGAEAAAASDNSPTLAQPVVNVYMAKGFIPYSIEVGMDYPNFANEMAALLDAGYSDLLLSKFSTGAGAASNEPTGIITALDADTTDEVLLTTAGSFGEVDLYALWKNLPQRWRQNASFMMSVGVNNAIRRFGTANVFHAYTVSLDSARTDQLFGRPVYESAYFPDLVSTTGHTNQLVVGDFSNYLIARRAGMTVELVSHLVDVTNNRPTGQRGWFAYARIGGGSINDNGFRLLNQT